MENEVTDPGVSTLRFALPIVAEYVLMSLIAAVNLSLVGHLGRSVLSAVGLLAQPVAVSLAVFQSIGVGVTALIARATGARDVQSVREVTCQALYTAVALGVALAAISFLLAGPIVRGMGAQPENLAQATFYMQFMALGMVFQAIPAAVTAVLRGSGDSTGPMRYNIITNLVNAAVGLLLIHGFWGLPALGLTGAAIATTFAKIVNTALALDALRRNGRAVAEEPVTVHPGRLPPPDMAIIRRIFRVGNSAAVESLAMRAGFIFYSRIIADLGILAFAAHQIILSVTQFVSNTMQGLSAAASSYTGWGLGAGEPQVARRHNRVLLHYGFLVSVVMGGLFFFFGTAIAALFSSDAAVVTLSGSILRIAGVITVPQCFLAILSGALRGAGDTKWPMYGAFAGVVIARVGLAYILVVPLGMGLYGAWLAALADQCIRAVFTTVRYGRGRWTQLYV